ncbi:hypothetical protein HME9304_01551 [Flagellimonas maritima]|uniref:Uncharacterized protein n=1 Tax=Flagellimonas maritima TaxID=1383885 RepID=A0A2Z4LT68_9FLAO|nr:hypothetical protein [Allomuricauda aurantiaca]AWX44548.1 hypothetical protein HME9304_01551 [Allomuricauda aurantiaca]
MTSALDIITHFILFRVFRYWRFAGNNDERHLSKTLQILRQDYLKEKGVIKEINILGLKSEKVCIKSTSYYIDLLVKIHSTKTLPNGFSNYFFTHVDIKNQNELFNFLTLYLTIENLDEHSLGQHIKNLIQVSESKLKIYSLHILLLKLRFDYQTGRISNYELVSNTIKMTNGLSIAEIMKSNSFTKHKSSTSHELGYFLNILFDIYEDTHDSRILDILTEHNETLHNFFVSRKTIFSNVLKRDNSMSLSGIFLISKLFLRYTLFTKDYRFSSAAFHMLDIGMYLQKMNPKGYISNTFPIYRYGSPMKYPSWTLCYFLDVLLLKEKVKKLLYETSVSV